MKTLQIAEWQRFGAKEIEKVCGDENKANKIFGELCEFAKEKGNSTFIGFYGANTLRAKNFVGLVQTKSGFCVEILPKIFDNNKPLKHTNCTQNKKPEAPKNEIQTFFKKLTNTESGDPNTESNTESNSCEACSAKLVLLNCLATLTKSPFKQSNLAHLHTLDMPLLEVFVLMFLNELEKLVKSGLKSDYIAVEQNRKFLKGKLLFNENLKYNFAHKERFFTSSDEFSADIAPNRLIKSTILFLCKHDFSTKTSARLNQMRFIFEDISESKNISNDFAKCPTNRNFNAYENLLAWCEVFLERKGFSTYSGSKNAFALLFDMNRLFESFVAHWLKKENKDKELIIRTQSKKHHLIKDENGQDLFQLRLDILVEKGDEILILDTKWKIPNSNGDVNDVSQGDLYQMWAYASAYAKDFNNVKVFLIYPKCERLNKIESEWSGNKKWHFSASENFSANKKITIELRFFPLI